MSFVERAESQFKNILSSAGAGEKRFRESAWKQYSRMGLPGRKTETWKYSSLGALTKSEWNFTGALADASILSEVESLKEKWRLRFDIAVLLDGSYRADLSEVGGYSIRPLEISAMPSLSFEDGWGGLSAALACPGYDLAVTTQLTRPLLIISANSGGLNWATSLNRISVDSNLSAEIALITLGPSEKYLRSDITFVDLKEAAKLSFVRIQQDSFDSFHFSEVHAQVAAGAQLYLTQVNGGSRWSRTSLRAQVTGELGEAHINGLTFGRASQHADQRVEIRHSAANTVSSQLFKGVLKDTARGILNGKIAIERDAQKVISSQMNHNLLLSKTAEADTKPELEIYADDVKANHGASVGRMDEEKLFYLMSRGIPRAQAQQMLAHAFVGDVLMKIEPALLREFADESVRGWLPDFMSGMEAHV